MRDRRTRPALPDPLLAEFSDFLAARIGLHFPEPRRADLNCGIDALARELGFADPEACVRRLMSSELSRVQVEMLASHLTVGETYFFRERKSFDSLEQHILPELIQHRRRAERRLRIWSAGCCTGEEPYSIAILLARMIPDLRDWNISILATDINARFLEKASRGVYSEWSFRDAPPGIRETFFRKTGQGRFEIASHVKSMVTFGYLNLAEDAYPSVESGTNAMDVIFCRNVLMYFEPAHAGRVLENLGRSLVEDGCLFVSPIEIPQVAVPQLAAVNFSGAVVFRKQSKAPRVAENMVLPVDISVAREAAPARAPCQQASDLYGQGRYADAAEKIGESLSREPADADAMALLARACANQGRLAEALDWCEKAVAADKLNPGRHYLLATILQELGEPERAAAALKRALYLDQRHALAHFALGNLVRRQGNRKESERHFRNALSILDGCPQDQVLPESEGITAGRLAEIIRSAVSGEVHA